MGKIKDIAKERASGFFLLFLAILIIAFFSSNSQSAKSNDKQDLADENFSSNKGELLGETAEDSKEVFPEVLEKTEQETNRGVDGDAPKEIDETATIDNKNNQYDELKSLLKKYCGKNGSDNRKKCKAYCSEAKANAKKDDQYDNLYEKYCTIETDIIIKGKGGNILAKYDNFNSASFEKITVFDLMKKASKEEKFSFHYENYSFGIFIYEISGLGSKDDMKNWWKLSVNGKDSSVGASDCKVSDGDKIEWEYTSASF